jgi:cell division protein ZapA
MSELNISINKRSYQVACDDGQEAHLMQLAQSVDKRVDELIAAMGNIGDQKLLVMVSLLLADEVEEAHRALGDLKEETRTKDVMSAPEAALSQDVERLADRLESMAARLEQI